MREHAATSARRLVDELGLARGSTMAEFASHHGGSWLPDLLRLGLVEVRDRPADVVVDVHGLAHEPDLASALRERVDRMDSQGHLVLEFHHLLALVTDDQFDTVRHGHPLYLSLLSITAALAPLGLRPMSVSSQRSFGGSLQVIAARSGVGDASVARMQERERAAGLDDPSHLSGLQDRAAYSGAALREWLVEAARSGRRVLGYGAPSKAAVLLTWSGVGPDLLPFTADLSAAKQGRRIPGAGIPIRSPEALVAARPDDVLVLAWDLLEEVRTQLPEVEQWGGRFVVPVPHPRVAD